MAKYRVSRVGRRVYRRAHLLPTGVYATSWRTLYARVTLRGRDWYLGAVDSPEHGAAVVSAFRRQMAAAEPAPFPEVTITRPA